FVFFFYSRRRHTRFSRDWSSDVGCSDLGITVHPRPDERHIRYKDVYDLKAHISAEFNIERNCQEQKFVELVLANKPAQVTLVPDSLDQITSNHGWDTIKHRDYLKEMVKVFKDAGIRVSIFVDPDEEMV